MGYESLRAFVLRLMRERQQLIRRSPLSESFITEQGRLVRLLFSHDLGLLETRFSPFPVSQRKIYITTRGKTQQKTIKFCNILIPLKPRTSRRNPILFEERSSRDGFLSKLLSLFR